MFNVQCSNGEGAKQPHPWANPFPLNKVSNKSCVFRRFKPPWPVHHPVGGHRWTFKHPKKSGTSRTTRVTYFCHYGLLRDPTPLTLTTKPPEARFRWLFCQLTWSVAEWSLQKERLSLRGKELRLFGNKTTKNQMISRHACGKTICKMPKIRASHQDIYIHYEWH